MMAAESAESEGGTEIGGRENFVTAKPGKEVGLIWGGGGQCSASICKVVDFFSSGGVSSFELKLPVFK